MTGCGEYLFGLLLRWDYGGGSLLWCGCGFLGVCGCLLVVGFGLIGFVGFGLRVGCCVL